MVSNADSGQSSMEVLLVGGGINGAGIALDAVGRGLSVALWEKGDLGGSKVFTKQQAYSRAHT